MTVSEIARNSPISFKEFPSLIFTSQMETHVFISDSESCISGMSCKSTQFDWQGKLTHYGTF